MLLLGELSAVLTATIWACTSLLISTVSSKIGSVQTNIGRMVASLFFFIVTILIFRLPLNISSTQALNLVLSSVVGIVFGDTFLFYAFRQIGARLSMLIMSLSPAIAAILAYLFLDETLSLWGIIGMILTLCGISLVVFERNAPIPSQYRVTRFGIVCAFLGALGQGGGVIFAKLAFLEGPIHGIIASFIRIAIAVFVLLPIAIVSPRVSNPVPLLRQERKVVLYLLLIAFFGTFGGVTLSLIAVAYAKVGIASTLIATSPVLMLPMVRVAYQEQLSWKATLGAFTAVVGVAILFLL
jgi:drug/metabolite transporter (DMT)-like permease